MKCENLFSKLLPYLVIFLAFLTVMGWDYTPALGDVYRGGRIRYLLMGLAVCQFIYLSRINPWWAAFSAWSFFLWCLFDFSGFGAADVALIPACLIVGHQLRVELPDTTVLKCLSWMAVAQGFYCILQVAGVDPFFPLIEPAFKNLALGTFGHYTIVAPFLALGAVYFASKWNWAWALFLIACVALTGSSMGIGALLAGLLYVVWRFQPRLGYIAGALGVVSLLGVYIANPRTELFNFNGRLWVWPRAMEGIASSPILGHGPGSFLELRDMWGLGKDSAGLNWDQLHQEYLQTWIETGLVGLLLVLFGLYYTMRICQKLNPIYGAWVLVLAVNSLANFPMHIAAYGLIAGWLAAVTWHQRSEQ